MNPANTDRSAAVRRCGLVAACLLALLTSGPGESAQAQNGDPPASESIQGRLLYRDDDGSVVPLESLLIDTKKIEQVVQWLTTQQNVPRYDTNITATGQVADGQARIHVDLQIEVHAEQDWVLVPVGFQSWTIQNFEHAPDRPDFEARFAGNASTQRQWYLRGRGSHTLSMDLIGDVRDRDADRQRLKLSVPNAVISSLELSFDEPVRNVSGNFGDQGPLTTTDEGSIVRVYGLKQETEITWESAAAADDQTTVITTPDPADMTLDLTTSTASLRCTQMVNVTDGTIERLSVRLPPGFSQAAITGTDDAGNRVVKSDDVTTVDGVSTAVIEFTRPLRRQVQLEYDLRRSDTESVQKISDTESQQTIYVSVPEIEGVAEQSGTVNIRIPRGLNVDIPPAPLTQRIRVEAQPGLLSEATAYELLSTEARLQVIVSEQQAQFSVAPLLEFSTDDQSLLLQAEFRINVSIGSLDELEISWQNFVDDGWQIVPGSLFLARDRNPPRELTHDVENDNKLSVMLDNFQSGNFSVKFRAFRDLISADDDVDGDSFNLPDVIARRGHTTTVSLVESDMYSLSLSSAHDDRSFSILPSARLSTSDDPGRTTRWLVGENDSGGRVRVERSQQTREIRSTAIVGLDAVRDSIQVHTEIDINVQHLDLPELRFTAYDRVNPVLTLSDGTELPLPERDGDEFVWQLPDPMRGQHTLTLQYLWTPRRDTDNIRLPLILPAGGVDSLIIGTGIPDVISVNDDRILPIYRQEFVAAWHSDEALADVGLHIPQALRQHQPQLPSICLVETQIGPVNITTRTTLFYDSVPETVLFSVPASAGVSAAVNDIRTDAPRIELGDIDSGEIRRISIPREAAEQPEDGVAVSLMCQTPRGPHHHLLSREAPACPRIVQPPEWLSTVWFVSTLQNDRLVSLNADHQSIPGVTTATEWFDVTDEQIPAAIDTALSGLPASVRQHFRDHYADSTVCQNASLAFISGPQQQDVPVMMYSAAMGWVIAGGLGILLYTALVTFRPYLKLIIALAVPAGILAWALLPQQTLSLLTPLLPALIAAVIAWSIRQLLMPSGIRRRAHRRRRTVFSASSRPTSSSSVTDSLNPAAPISGAEPAVQ